MARRITRHCSTCWESFVSKASPDDLCHVCTLVFDANARHLCGQHSFRAPRSSVGHESLPSKRRKIDSTLAGRASTTLLDVTSKSSPADERKRKTENTASSMPIRSYNEVAIAGASEHDNRCYTTLQCGNYKPSAAVDDWHSDLYKDLSPADSQVLSKDESCNMCFICGASFARATSGMKGRLNHIKLCARKHGVAAQDVRLNDDSEAFRSRPSRDSHPKSNGTSRTTNSRQLERVTTNISSLPPRTLGTCSSKRSAQTRYVKPPLRSINNVLLGSGRRVAKTAELSIGCEMKNGKSHEKTNAASLNRGHKHCGIQRQLTKARPCPSYKRIPGTNFICDGFCYPNASVKNYFLTHFHSDHYQGITCGWRAGTIFCSLPTANLVHDRLGVQMKFIHPLGLNTPFVVENNGRPVTVTLFDANHCPGAVMFLFEVDKKNILHVGDFRWHKEKMMKSPLLKAISLGQPELDELFLDTTYCHERYDLPLQDIAIKATVHCAVSEVQQASSANEKLLLLFGAYTIGKERIYLSVAKKLGKKVYVDAQRHRVLSALAWPEEQMRMITTRKDESNLWIVPLSHINMKGMQPYVFGLSKAMHRERKYDRVVGFRASGWSNVTGSSVISSRATGRFTVYSVPYSEHSSFPELCDCVRTLRPKKITPTVNVGESQRQVDLLLQSVSV